MTGEPQSSIRGRSRHPSARFEPFALEDIEQSVPARFEKQVDRHADRIAVRTPAETLTYADLDRLANRIAHAILARTGEGGEPVAILFEHDAAGIAAVLGVLKAGCCYVPLDPASPAAHSALLLADAGARLIVTHGRCRALAERLAGEGAVVLDVGPSWRAAPDARRARRHRSSERRPRPGAGPRRPRRRRESRAYRAVVAVAGAPAGRAVLGAAPGRNAMNTVPSAEIPAISISSVVNPAALTVGPSR